MSYNNHNKQNVIQEEINEDAILSPSNFDMGQSFGGKSYQQYILEEDEIAGVDQLRNKQPKPVYKQFEKSNEKPNKMVSNTLGPQTEKPSFAPQKTIQTATPQGHQPHLSSQGYRQPQFDIKQPSNDPKQTQLQSKSIGPQINQVSQGKTSVKPEDLDNYFNISPQEKFQQVLTESINKKRVQPDSRSISKEHEPNDEMKQPKLTVSLKTDKFAGQSTPEKDKSWQNRDSKDPPMLATATLKPTQTNPKKEMNQTGQFVALQKGSSSDQSSQNIVRNGSAQMNNKQVPLCSIHKLEITLICCVSQWHCEALCIDCIPDHTEQHNKNRSQPQLKRFDQIKSECMDKCEQLSQQLSLHKQKLMEEQERQYNDQNLMNLQEWKANIIQLVQVYFEEIEQDYIEKTMVVHYELNQKLLTVQQEIEKVQNDLLSFKHDLNTNQSFIKGISNTMKINVDVYVTDLVQEIKRIQSTYVVSEELKLNHILVKYLHENIARLVILEKAPTKEQLDKKNKQNVKEQFQKVKLKNKLCPNCGEQMKFVSEFQKHLECPKCTKVKRNYTKKDPI